MRTILNTIKTLIHNHFSKDAPKYYILIQVNIKSINNQLIHDKRITDTQLKF